MHKPADKSYINFTQDTHGFSLCSGSNAAALCLHATEHPGVIRAVRDLQTDIASVTGISPELVLDDGIPDSRNFPRGTVLCGTIGSSPLIDFLVSSRLLDIRSIQDKKEAFIIAVVNHPGSPGRSNVVIAGTDRRGTVYGIYDLAESIGISPWSWWTGATPVQRDSISIQMDEPFVSWPTVRYRGIFLNDEYPALTRWVAETWGPCPLRSDPPVPEGVANYGSGFYTRIFELILRLKGNYLWPAMWNNAFNEDDPLNPVLAHEYGIVMGNSHQEPMLRAQKEWDRRYGKTLGHWSWTKHKKELIDFWRDGIRRNREYDSIVSIGLRGADDTPMADGGADKTKFMLEEIIDAQRTIIAEETNGKPDGLPQLWCPYKEAKDYYDLGMQVPDDVTILWSDDNWGNIRRLPTGEERKRQGGAGIYYHFDYHGGPRSYQWINTSPIAKIRDQMCLAAQYGADRIWIVNVGHFRGYEYPLEYFMHLAWDPEGWGAVTPHQYSVMWAEREFGDKLAGTAARLVEGYSRINGRCKPELLSPSTWSQTLWREAELIVREYQDLVREEEKARALVPRERVEAWLQLIGLPVKACSIVNSLYFAAGRSALFARQGRSSSRLMKELTEDFFREDLALMEWWNKSFAGGKWNHFMDQTHLGYTSWCDPEENSLRAIDFPEPVGSNGSGFGVALEGQLEAAITGSASARLVFDSLRAEEFRLEVFGYADGHASGNLGEPLPRESWIRLEKCPPNPLFFPDQTWSVSVDYAALPEGRHTGSISVSDGIHTILIEILVLCRGPLPVCESGEAYREYRGFISLPACGYTAIRDGENGSCRWTFLEDYGRIDSGMRAESTAGMDSLIPGRNAPCLEYRFHTHTGGTLECSSFWGPSLNIMPHRGLRYAISLDDGEIRIITLVPQNYNAEHDNPDWEKAVILSIREGKTTFSEVAPGFHTLSIWMVDPGLVLEKTVITTGRSALFLGNRQRDDRLGPPPSPKA